MYRTSFTRLFDLDPVGFDGDGSIRSPSDPGALLFVASFPPILGFRSKNPTGTLVPANAAWSLCASPSQSSAGRFPGFPESKSALARAFGGLDGFDKQVIGVGFALVGSRGFSNIHGHYM